MSELVVINNKKQAASLTRLSCICTGSIRALTFRAFSMSDFRQFLCVIQCNVLVCEQFNSDIHWPANIHLGRGYRLLWRTLCTVSPLLSTKPLRLCSSDFTFKCIEESVVYLNIIKGSKQNLKWHRRVTNEQCVEDLSDRLASGWQPQDVRSLRLETNPSLSLETNPRCTTTVRWPLKYKGSPWNLKLQRVPHNLQVPKH